MKKWINKKEILKILRMYSVRADEFEEFGSTDCSFKSRVVNGYVITISEEMDADVKTGRIKVQHTKSSGKYTFTDIWEHNEDKKLEFVSRNLKNPPPSDTDIINDLKEENERFRQKGLELQQELRIMTEQHKNQKLDCDTSGRVAELEDQLCRSKEECQTLQNKYQNLINENNSLRDIQRKYYELKNDTESKAGELENQLNELTKKYQTLQNECQKLKNENHTIITAKQESESVRNPRGAGRKKLSKEQEKLIDFSDLLEKGYSQEEIMNEMEISRATYFRYKKVLKNNK